MLLSSEIKNAPGKLTRDVCTRFHPYCGRSSSATLRSLREPPHFSLHAIHRHQVPANLGFSVDRFKLLISILSPAILSIVKHNLFERLLDFISELRLNTDNYQERLSKWVFPVSESWRTLQASTEHTPNYALVTLGTF